MHDQNPLGSLQLLEDVQGLVSIKIIELIMKATKEALGEAHPKERLKELLVKVEVSEMTYVKEVQVSRIKVTNVMAEVLEIKSSSDSVDITSATKTPERSNRNVRSIERSSSKNLSDSIDITLATKTPERSNRNVRSIKRSLGKSLSDSIDITPAIKTLERDNSNIRSIERSSGKNPNESIDITITAKTLERDNRNVRSIKRSSGKNPNESIDITMIVKTLKRDNKNVRSIERSSGKSLSDSIDITPATKTLERDNSNVRSIEKSSNKSTRQDLKRNDNKLIKYIKQLFYNKSRRKHSLESYKEYSLELHGRYLKSRKVLKDITDEQYKSFRDKIVQILSGLDD
ncbi:3982_t:CDS:2 [Funneliformis caledonium]|uniref:3982_t:CDS:1 n=1 Tax=Funneliformis caledonium TaxID=1117310 RepID=A0A9N9HUD2_9GLOM|nr:3982_t:CDS:2 [Funneliformis caledonium]